MQILHIMSASLNHAQPVLSSAINAGFRESGVQSLRALDDRKACPMVAVRTAGLSLESIIGVLGACKCEEDSCDCANGMPTAIVDEDYLELLVGLANERFAANSDRIERFRIGLREALAAKTRREKKIGEWEDAATRRLRKRQEGLESNATSSADLGKLPVHATGRSDEQIIDIQQLHLGG